ncbi:MAG: hypothetical protein ACE5EK_04835, partial [Nitrospinales bacterium]
MDYAAHALSFGYEVNIVHPKNFPRLRVLFRLRQFKELLSHPNLKLTKLKNLRLQDSDRILFSIPPDYGDLKKQLGHDLNPQRAIHLIQNFPNAEPESSRDALWDLC